MKYDMIFRYEITRYVSKIDDIDYVLDNMKYDMISPYTIIRYDNMKYDKVSMYAIICYVCTMLSPLSIRLTPRKPFFRLLGIIAGFQSTVRSSWLNQKKSSILTFVHVELLYSLDKV